MQRDRHAQFPVGEAHLGECAAHALDGAAQALERPFGHPYSGAGLQGAALHGHAALALGAAQALQVAVTSVSLASMFTRPGFLNASNGRLNTSDTSYASTKLLDLNWIEIKQVKLLGLTTIASIAFYDENQGFISASAVATNNTYVTTIPSIPSNAVYVAFCYKISDAANEILRVAFKPAADALTPQAVADNQMFLDRAFSRQGFHNASSSLFQADSTWRTTPLIDLGYLWVSRINLTGNGNVNSIAFYDEAGAFISGVVGTTGSRVATVPSIPSGAYYFSMTYQLSDVVNCSISVVSTAAVSPWRADGKIAIDVGSKLTNSGYVDTAGLVVITTGWTYSDFIKISPGEKVGLSLYGHPNISNVAFYDANLQFISGLTKTGPASVWTQTATAPAGAVYFRLSSNTTAKTAIYTTSLSAQLLASSSVATPKFTATPFKRPRAMRLTSTNKVVVYGDSRSDERDYPWIPTVLASVTGTATVGAGISGSSIPTQVTDANMAALFARNADVVIWLPAGNQQARLGTVGTFDGTTIGEPIVPQSDISLDFNATTYPYMIQALDHGVRKWLAQYYNIRARAGLTGSETETEKNNKIRAVQKPMLILCSDLPQKRSGDPYISDPANWERKRQAIIEVANRNKVHCVDTMAVMGWDMSLEPSWTSPSDKVTNNGIYTMDGLHFNEHGALAIYQVVCADAGLV